MSRSALVALVIVLCACTRASSPSQLGLDPYLKDSIDAATRLLGALSVVIAALALYMNARTRKQDLRWRMATAARELLADIHRHPRAVEAVTMMDCHLADHVYNAPASASVDGCKDIDFDRVCMAMTARGGNDQVDTYIYECFDWFFYYLDRIAYLDTQTLIETIDVAAPLVPYARLLRSRWTCFQDLVETHNYISVAKFLETLDQPVARLHLTCSPSSAHG